ncbi:hypothetical protein ACK3OH_004535 [Salmonella enterica]
MSESSNKKHKEKDIKEDAFYFITLFCIFLFTLVRGAASSDDSFAFGLLRWLGTLFIILGVAYYGSRLIENGLIYIKYKGDRDE